MVLEINKIYNLNCLDGLKRIFNKTIDLAFIDPPYNEGVDFGVYKDNLPHNEYIKRMEDVINELRRVTRRGFGIYVDLKRFCEFRKIIPKSKAIIVYKREPYFYAILTTAAPLIPYHAKLLDTISFTKREMYKHPAQTPLAFVRRYVECFSKEREIILDCFMGVGTTAIVCEEMNRNFIGFEINPKFVEIANKRLLTLQNYPKT